MSYCRFSSNFGQCDVYVYEDVSGGWTTHVAGRRLKHKVPEEIQQMCRDIDWNAPDAVERLAKQMEAEEKWRSSLPSDEFPCTYTDGEKEWRGTYKTPKDSEYIDLSTLGPEAGETYNDPTPGECADRLERLRSNGFLVPQYAIDALREEARSEA